MHFEWKIICNHHLGKTFLSFNIYICILFVCRLGKYYFGKNLTKKLVSQYTWLHNQKTVRGKKTKAITLLKKRGGGGSGKEWSWSQNLWCFFFKPSLSSASFMSIDDVAGALRFTAELIDLCNCAFILKITVYPYTSHCTLQTTHYTLHATNGTSNTAHYKLHNTHYSTSWCIKHIVLTNEVYCMEFIGEDWKRKNILKNK